MKDKKSILEIIVIVLIVLTAVFVYYQQKRSGARKTMSDTCISSGARANYCECASEQLYSRYNLFQVGSFVNEYKTTGKMNPAYNEIANYCNSSIKN